MATNDSTETLEADLSGAVSGLPTGDLSFSIDGVLDPVAETGTFEFGVGEASIEILLLEDVAYVRSDDDAFASALPEGAEWVEVDPAEFESIGLNATFNEGAGFSPQIFLVFGAEDVQAGEAGDVGGDPVREYSFSIDQTKAIEEAPPEAQDAVRDAITLEGENPTIEGEASIDGEGRLRSFDAHGTAGSPFGGEIEVNLETEFTDFAVELDTEAPGEDEVVPLADAPEAVTALQELIGGSSS